MTGYTRLQGDVVRKGRQQDWTIGQIVNVGFVRDLRVVSGNQAAGWQLVAEASGNRYRFVPHLGLERVA